MRGERAEPGEPKGEEVAALAGDERVELIEDHRVEVGEETGRVGGGEEERHLLGRGEQDVGRLELLPLALVDRRVAGARLDRDREAHLADRRLEVPRDVDGERLERRDVEGVDAAALRPVDRRPLVERRQRRQEAGEGLPRPGRCNQQRRPSLTRLPKQFQLMRPRRPSARREPRREGRGEYDFDRRCLPHEGVHAGDTIRPEPRSSTLCSASVCIRIRVACMSTANYAS